MLKEDAQMMSLIWGYYEEELRAEGLTWWRTTHESWL
jgi:hypothetical protein